MIYTIFIGIAFAIVISILIVGLICIMLIAGENDREIYQAKKKNNKKATKNDK